MPLGEVLNLFIPLAQKSAPKHPPKPYRWPSYQLLETSANNRKVTNVFDFEPSVVMGVVRAIMR